MHKTRESCEKFLNSLDCLDKNIMLNVMMSFTEEMMMQIVKRKLEQLESLRSEDTPPPPHDYPYYWVRFDPKSKEDKVKVTNVKNLP